MNDLAPSQAHVGSSLGDRYDLVRHIARGGMGDVFEAVDRVLDRRAAVKVFRSASPTDRERFDAEIRLLASLDHPTLVRIYDAGSTGDDAYLVMELVDGPTLAARLEGSGALPADEVAAIGREVAAALAFIHERGVVHRDVTTSNVLCQADGRVRLVDFGIARLLGSPRVTATATTIGTAAFMAPEQVAGEEVTGASDVYSLGLVLLELLTGRRAFEGTAAEVAAGRLVRDPDTEAGVPTAWRPLLRAMTGREPSQRPSAAVVRDRLDRMARSAPTDATVATAPVPVVAPVAPLGGTDPDATAVLHAGGSTAVLPVPVPPPEAPLGPPGRSRPPGGTWMAWVLAAGVAAVALVLVLASLDDGNDGPSDTTTTSTTAASVVDPVPTTVAPTTTATPTTVPTTVADTLPPTTLPAGFPFDGGEDPAPPADGGAAPGPG